MESFIGLALEHRLTFLLVFARVSAMVAIAPVFGHRSVPVSHRAGLALLFTLLLTPIVPAARAAGDGLGLVLAIAGELLVGVAIGAVATLVLAAVQVAGDLIGFQTAMSVGAVYDPASGGTATVFARFYEMLALLLFLALDGHHALVAAVAGSFQRLGPGVAFSPEPLAAGLMSLTAKVVRGGLELSAPLVGLLFAVNVVLGLLARVSPSLNIFGLAMPLGLGAALVASVAVLPSMLTSVARLFGGVPADIAVLFGGARGLR